MTGSTCVATKDSPGINEPGRLVVQQLDKQVANAFILYANYKHYHWQAFGPFFRDLHLLFDEFANSVLATADEFAERLRMMGHDPVFDYRAILEISNLKPSIPGETMGDMVREARDNLLSVISDMRDATRLAGEDNDPGTVDLFSKVVQLHEKHEWFLRQILLQSDGLTGQDGSLLGR
jgi:starvation-inducible DNA-binding protein